MPFSFVSLGEFLDSAPPQREWIIEDWLPAGANILVSGQQKATTKSTTIIALSLIAAAGGRYKDLIAPEPRRIWWWLQEGSHKGIQLDIEALIVGMDLDREAIRDNIMVSYAQPFGLDVDEHFKEIAEHVVPFAPDLMVLDPLAQIHGGDENKVQDLQVVTNSIMEMQNQITPRPSALLITHLNKGFGADKKAHPDLQVRGNTYLPSWYDKHIALRNYDLRTPAIDVTLLDKHAAMQEFTLTWQREMQSVAYQRPDGTFRQEREPVKATPRLTEISSGDYEDLLSRLEPDEGYTPKRLALAWDLDAHTASRILQEMRRAGTLQRDSADNLYYLPE